MNNRKPWIANTFWQLTAYPAWVQFHRATKRVFQHQQAILLRYLKENKNTIYGRRYSFESIDDISAYQQQVPLTTYDDYTEEIDKICAGAPNILTTSPVRIFELSSGSTAPSKLIPYTNRLRHEFQAGISPWIYDLFQNNPLLKRGSAYWSISPLTQDKRHTSGGIPIGFEEDSSYLGSIGKLLAGSIFAVPNEVKHIQDIENFKYVSLLFLLINPDLQLISIWNPTFFSLLLTSLPDWWQQLLMDIKAGSLLPPNPIAEDTLQVLNGKIRPNPQRADQLSRVNPADCNQIWPDLQLISCWMDGPSRVFVNELREFLPGVSFQPKGLIATEAFVSFPMTNLPGSALAVTAHFFEFLPLDEDSLQANEKKPLLAHELEKGKKYSVVVTTGGGFYRYILQDIIEVVGSLFQVPLIRFVSKINRISDWFGEKLNEFFVSSVLGELFQVCNFRPIFAMLSPNDSDMKFRYTLYLELPQDQLENINLGKTTTILDRKLCRNFHYDYCRKLGQISHPDVFIISDQAQQAYLMAKQTRGQKMGDIKHTFLETTTGWDEVFAPTRSSTGVSNRSSDLLK